MSYDPAPPLIDPADLPEPVGEVPALVAVPPQARQVLRNPVVADAIDGDLHETALQLLNTTEQVVAAMRSWVEAMTDLARVVDALDTAVEKGGEACD